MAHIGIDLGTTNSSVSVMRERGPVIIKNSLGKDLTPSVVSIDRENDNEILVGEVAKNRLITHPDQTVSIFKTFMGADKEFQVSNASWRPEQLSALILKSLKQDAEDYLKGEEIEAVVISVPAYFNNSQRQAVRNAAKIAGIELSDLICEPTAAALAYGLGKKEDGADFIVLDIGGGTFDVTLIEVFSGMFEIKASAGNNRLGGEDFTNAITNDFFQSVTSDPSSLDLKAQARVRDKCDQLKHALSRSGSARFDIEIDGHSYEYSITNDRFEEISKGLLEKIKDPIVRVLKDTNYDLDDIDYVVMVGGSSRLRVFKNLIERYFPDSIITGFDPDLAISKGAALKAHINADTEAVKEYVVTDVTPFTLGVNMTTELLERVVFTPVIERNTAVPVSRVIACSKPLRQSRLRVGVYQGESLSPKSNHKLGDISFEDLPFLEELDVEIQFTFDVNGILQVDVRIPSKKIRKSLVIKNSEVDMTDEEIEEYVLETKKLKILPKDEAKNKLVLSRLERVFEETVGQQRESARYSIECFTYALREGSPIEIEKTRNKADVFLSKYNFDEG